MRNHFQEFDGHSGWFWLKHTLLSWRDLENAITQKEMGYIDGEGYLIFVD